MIGGDGLGFGRSQADVLLSISMVKERKKREDDSGDATGVHYGVASSFSQVSLNLHVTPKQAL